MTATSGFTGRTFVVRVDESTARADATTFIDDLHVLRDRGVAPILVAPDAASARDLVRAINRSANIAVGLSGADAALLPQTSNGIGVVQTRILETLTGAGFVPIIEPTAFAIFERDDAAAAPDEVAAALAASCDAVRAIFFHRAGGLSDPSTDRLLDEVTPAEALEIAEDPRTPRDLCDAARAAALGVRSGVEAAQIVDGRLAHAMVLELITARHAGTHIVGGVVLAA